MPRFWAFLLLLIVNLALGHNESIDPREDMDLLEGIQGLPDDLPEEIRRAFSEDIRAEDTVKLIDVNVPEEKLGKEPPRRKQASPVLDKLEGNILLKD
jgi:hypothetical protein